METKKPCEHSKLKNLLAAHAFDYTVLRTNPGLTSCKDLVMVVDNILDDN